jgi:uncharacterized membrane protein
MLKLIIAILLTLVPLIELRLGLPLAITYAIEEGISVWPIFLLIVLLNILLIFLVFFFLDYFHEHLIKWKFYRKIFGKVLKRIQKKVDKFEKRQGKWGFLALTLFVSVPLPGTGAWSGCLVSWILGLERKKSILAIALGVIIAGTIIFFATLGAADLLLSNLS